jgi:hypothetical protein
MDDRITPKGLAQELPVTDKTIRAYLRERFGAEHDLGTLWLLKPQQADDVRRRFPG